MDIKIASSILCCDFLHLSNEIEKLENSDGVDYIHLDIMDGNFVPNLSFGPYISELIAKNFSVPIETHLMVSNPIKFVEKFYFSHSIIFHIESNDCPMEVIDRIKFLDMKVGIAINPETSFEKMIDYIDYLDIILVMTVSPGFGGQKFLDSQINKIKDIKSYVMKNHKNVSIGVDGGINSVTSQSCIDAGATNLVVGSFLNGAKDISSACHQLIGDF